MKQPITSGAMVRSHGNVNSDVMNSQWDETYYSLYDLYQQVNKDKVNAERAIAFLESELTAVSQQIDSINNQSYSKVTPRYMTTVYPNANQNSSDTSPRCFIDQQSNVATLPLNGAPIPKTFAYDIFQQQSFVGSDTVVSISTPTQKDYIGDDPLYLVDPNQQFWAGTITDNLNSIPIQEEITVEIDLSTNVISNYQANTIVFIPHPLYTMSISDMQYHLNSSWQNIPGFSAMDNITACRWCFSPINAKSYQFTLAQPTYVQSGNQAIYTFGSQQFGVYYQGYQSSGIVLSSFNITPQSSIASITHNFANASCLGAAGSSFTTAQPFFSFELYKEESNGLLTYLPNWSNINASTVWVKTTMNMAQNTTPALTSVELDIA
jgi:hypothetical protein